MASHDGGISESEDFIDVVEDIGGRSTIPVLLFQPAEAVWRQTSTCSALLSGVQFMGVKKTDRQALMREVSGIFPSKTLDELIRNAHLAAQHMTEVGLFDRVKPLITTSDASPDGYDVIFLVNEPGPFKFSIKLNCQVPSGTPEAQGNLERTSVWGRGESISASYARTTKGGIGFDLAATKPFLGWQKYSSVTGSLFRGQRSLDWNTASLTETGLLFQFHKRYTPLPLRIQQLVRLNAVWRQFLPSGNNTPFAVREHAGHTTKFSVEHHLSFDSRAKGSPLVSRRGLFAEHVLEAAGLLGDCSFLRHSLQLQMSTPLFGDFFAGASLSAATVRPIGRRSLHLLDRLYLGGPYNLRGFAANSIGGAQAEDRKSSLGGAVSVCGALHLYHPLPQPKDSLFAHAFLAAGSVASVRSRNVLRDLAETPRLSAGLGLVGVLGPIRLELNYTVPLRYASTDQTHGGIQLGVGNDFL